MYAINADECRKKSGWGADLTPVFSGRAECHALSDQMEAGWKLLARSGECGDICRSSPPPLVFHKLLIAVSSTCLLSVASGCANPVVQRTYWNYQERAEAAGKAGDFRAAEWNYERALSNVRIGNLGPEMEAEAAYNLAITKRLVCKPEEAGKLFQLALQSGEKASSPPERTMPRLFESARYYYDHGRYAEAAGLFQRGFEMLYRHDIPQSFRDLKGPYGLGYNLDLYADALRKVNRPDVAATVEVKLRDIPPQYRQEFNRKAVTTVPVRARPTGIAVAEGAVWVALQNENALMRINPASLTEMGALIPVGKQPGGGS